MKHLLTGLFVMMMYSAFGQLSIDTTGILLYDKISQTTTDLSQYPGSENMGDGNFEWYNHFTEDYSEVDTIPPFFKIDTLSAVVYSKYKKRYHSGINSDSSLVSWSDTTFSINAPNWKKSFKADQSDYEFYEYYLGFQQFLNLYIIWSIDGHNEVGTLKLIDRNSGKEFYLESPFDEPCETIFISPKNNSLITFANTWYENDHAFISLMKINRNIKIYKLQKMRGLYLDNMNILELVWINEHSFAVAIKNKGNTADGSINKVVDCYLRVSF